MAEKLLLENEETAENAVETTADEAVEATETAEATEAAETTEVVADELDELRDAIRALEEKEAIVTEKLCLAKEMGLTKQAEKCRELLQTVVWQKTVKKGELQEAEARRAASELDLFTAELEKEFTPEPVADEQLKVQSYYVAKAKRTGLIAKIVGYVGVISCVLGALAYLILTQPEVLNIPFEWLYLAAVGAGAVIFLIIALMINSSAKGYLFLADQIEEKRQEDERKLVEQVKVDALTLDRLRAATEANAAEASYKAEENTQKENEPVKKKTVKIGNIELPEMPKLSEDTKKKIHKIAPFAAAGAIVVTVVAISRAQKKSAAIKRSAALRREFFNWLG